MGLNHQEGRVKPEKPLGIKSYGSICHLPGSRIGPADRKLNPGQARILTEKTRDKHDVIIVQEKLDGSNVGVAKINGQIIALGRAGYLASSSPYEQHKMFADWVKENESVFAFLEEGERVCGEWLAQAHGTRYKLRHGPFVAFDIIRGHERLLLSEVNRLAKHLPQPQLLSIGPPITIDAAMKLLGGFGDHGACDPVEGAVWRVERKGKVDFLGKYVRPEKVDGCYLPDISGKEAVWNWRPSSQLP